MSPSRLYPWGSLVACFAAVVLCGVSAGMRTWISASGAGPSQQAVSVGLFSWCLNGDASCSSDVDNIAVLSKCGNHTLSSVTSRLRAQQGLMVVTVIVGGLTVVGLVLRVSCGLPIPFMLTVATGAVASLTSMITFSLFADFYTTWMYCGTTYCDMLKKSSGSTFSCGFRAPLWLCVIGWILFLLCVIGQLIDRKHQPRRALDGGRYESI